ncbi:MAG: 4Fe-4S binding protein [Firmicutes bacterium]|jgi:NAD-dependent dihydropyrimidine dehydrogenase PreA subunit|nr:4Fe-4S binding protein [Bacillota bacterium]
MIRRIIKIDEEKCNGCGLCAEACHEGAIAIIDGKAKLIRDDYCDGLGDCLPVCPVDAISFEEREAAPFDEEAVLAHLALRKAQSPCQSGCCTSKTDTMETTVEKVTQTPASELKQWPVQIKLVPVKAAFFADADLLIAADCTAFACGDFHSRFMRNKVTLIGCPKLDMVDYSEKLTAIVKENNIKSITVVRMTVPCCGGLEAAVKTALANSGKDIPCQVFKLE